MAGFNKGRVDHSRTTNNEGGKAFKLSPKAELFSAVATTFLENKYYESADERLERISQLVDIVDDDMFVAKLAVYARKEMNLRSVPVALTVMLAKRHNGDDLVRRTARNVIGRADELSEMVACYCGFNAQNTRKGAKPKAGRRISKQLSKGIADAFTKFDEYQLSKYTGKGREFSLKDVMNLVRPKPKDDEQRALFERLADKKLKPAYTWERELSVAGGSEAEKREAWQKIIESGRLGYMAMLRNLANFIKVDVGPKHIEMVCERIEDAEQVAKSRQLPYRFLTAYRILFGSRHTYGETPAAGCIYAKRIAKALDSAATHSAQNLPINKTERVCNASDVSASMHQQISGKSIVLCYDIGLMMAATYASKCEYVTTGIFGNDWMEVPVGDGGILTEVDRMDSYGNRVGFSTNGYKVIREARKKGKVYDRFAIWCDGELYGGDIQREWDMYRRDVNPKAKLMLVNLAGYGTEPVRVGSAGIIHVSGFSDKIWDMINVIENGESMVSLIDKVKLS